MFINVAVTVVLQGCYLCFCQLLFILHRHVLGLYCLPYLDIYGYEKHSITLKIQAVIKKKTDNHTFC